MTKSRPIPEKWDKSYFLVEQVKVELVNTVQPNTAVTTSLWLIDPSFGGLSSNKTFH
jgi:hypothetical protein